MTPGKLLIIGGVFLVLSGLLINFLPRLTWLGKLPGDIFYKGEKFTFYFPAATSLLVSALLTLLLWFFRK